MNHSKNIAWLVAIVLGSLLNISFFLILPKLGRTEPPAPPPVITLDFVQLQLPVEKKKIQPKPEPKKVIKKKPEQQLKKPEPKPKPVSPAKPIKKPVFTEAPEIKPPVEQPKPVEPEPVSEPVPQMVEPVEPEKPESKIVEEEVLPIPTPIFQLTSMPRMIHRETPVYPSTMRAQGKEGRVKLEVLIDDKGKVRQITVVKSAGEAFDQAAIAAIAKSNFTPGNIDGKPVAVLLKLPVNFKLR